MSSAPSDRDPAFWQRKLAAFLHDPPEKAYDFGPAHQQRAEAHAASFGVAEVWRSLVHQPDWTAAAADRFVFPRGGAAGVGGLGESGPSFVHPLSGRAADGGASLRPEHFPGRPEAEKWLADIRPEWRARDPEAAFYQAWRVWPAHAAQHAGGERQGAVWLPYLPADTRVPDASIWHHCAVVSALQAAGKTPAFLLFQIGPVQEFISQARSVRDLWSGSYLLSWLVMHAIRAVARLQGPDAIIFPSLRGQPLYDFLEGRRLGLRTDLSSDDAILTPGIPNRFLALVPADFDPAIAQEAFLIEWRRIASTTRSWLAAQGLSVHHGWDDQVANHWSFSWQLTPWKSVSEAMHEFERLPMAKKSGLKAGRNVAMAIPAAQRDDRCYRSAGELDPGWAWSAHYQICQHALDARRSLRDFSVQPVDLERKPGHRDCLSGREEAVVQAGEIGKAMEDGELARLFRHAEPLGAANLVKRVWHRAYLSRLSDVTKADAWPLPALKRARTAFDSVPAVAAATWRQRLLEGIRKGSEVWTALIHVSERLDAARELLSGFEIPDQIGAGSKVEEERYLDRLDAELLTEQAWSALPAETRQRLEIRASAEAVRNLKQVAKLDEPPSYYAVLALDGDQVGKWLSGERSPAVCDVITEKAAAWFLENLPSEAPAWLRSPRPISPSWHLQFSEALANFGLHAARRIVEEVHFGQLIYSGGDDVLAMLPAASAVACAQDLRAAFQGRLADMSAGCAALFRDDAPEGFLWLKSPGKGDPTWPLLVPGPRMSVSVGLAIGHVREPLQEMVQEAQRAEKRAKADPERLIWNREDPEERQEWRPKAGWGRDAFAVTLYKRSGEMVCWGARFGSPAWPLLQYLQAHYRQDSASDPKTMPIHGRFPYRLAGLLEVYAPETPLTPELSEIAAREFAHVVGQQTEKVADSAAGFSRTKFCELAGAYLDYLAQFRWVRPGAAEQDATPCPRPLREFIDLFLLEAFLRRQAD